MTNTAALAATVNYPVDDIKIQKLLIDNKITPDGEYTGLSQDFEVATAGLYVLLVTSANITEGGYQISMTDKSNMIDLATGIYNKYGLDNPLVVKPKIVDMSDRW
jgi:hypothetical protein